MRRPAELRANPAPVSTGEAKHHERPLRRPLATLAAAVLLVAASALPASAQTEEAFRFEQLPENFRYEYVDDDLEVGQASFSYVRNEERSIAAPTKFRLKSILQYTTPLGDTGLNLKLKMPLKLRKLVKLEIRF